MASKAQKEAAKENIKKAQETWQNMSSKERAESQPEGEDNRERPGEGGEGDYYHISIRNKEEFEDFRYQDVGDEGGLQRLGGKRKDGSWDTQKWIVEKNMAHVEDGKLIPDSKDAKEMFESEFEDTPTLVKGDIFEAKPKNK